MKTQSVKLAILFAIITCLVHSCTSQSYKNDNIRYQPVNLTSEDRQVLTESLADLHKKYDPAEKMISTTINGWNYHRDAESGVFHDVRSSFGYAVKLLDLGDEQFEQRAFDIIEKTITLQDQDTASGSCGVWPYYMEEPLATKKAPIDFNWADFNGVLLLDVWMGHQSKIPEALKGSIKKSLILAARSIQKRNVPPGYTNIAIMGTYVTYMVSNLFDIPGMQEYAGKRLQIFYDYTLSKGGFSEYNSLTYSRVALEELARMRMYITGPSEKQMLDSLNSIGWDMIARHYHKPTRQWTGPQSRSYCNFTGPTFFRLLAKASNGQIGYEKREKPSYRTSVYVMDVKLKHQIPDHLMHFFLSPEYPRTEIDLFEKEEPQIIGTCYMTDEYALSTVNRSSMWNQRRPFLAYWGSKQQPKYLQVRFLRDFYDFSSATFYSSQEEERALAGISIATNGGNKHLNIDILKEGKISASDLRLRFEFGNVQEQDALAIPSSNHDPFSFSLEGMQFNIQLYQAVFGKEKGHWEKGGDEESCWIDYVFHSDEETVFNLSEMEQAFFGFTFSIGAQKSTPSSDAPEFSISGGNLNTTWQGLSLEVPVKPHPNPKHL